MRILQIVTFVSPDGAFGGPVTVAVNQCAALQALGHETHLAGGHVGAATVVSRGPVGIHLFPVHRVVPRTGFAGLTSVALLRWLKSQADSWDIVHVHLARDLVSLPAARLGQLEGRPVVVQTHGMIDPSERLLARPLDAALTRPVLRRAAAVCHLTSLERDQLVAVAGGDLRLVPLANGVPVPDVSARADGDEVLFLARLQARKRPTAFVEAALRLARRHPRSTFCLVGPDEGEGAAVRAMLDQDGTGRLRWEGAVPPERVLERLSRAAIYVLPSVDEPYPMTVLEAFSLGIPVVVTDSCGLAEYVSGYGAGIVVGRDARGLARAIDLLLTDRDLRTAMGANAKALSRTVFSMDIVAHRLESLYASVREGGHLDAGRPTARGRASA